MPTLSVVCQCRPTSLRLKFLNLNPSEYHGAGAHVTLRCRCTPASDCVTLTRFSKCISVNHTLVKSSRKTHGHLPGDDDRALSRSFFMRIIAALKRCGC